MTSTQHGRSWTPLAPGFKSSASTERYLDHGRVLASLPTDDVERAESLARAHRVAISATGISRADRQRLLAACHVLTDLARQGWGIRVWKGRVEVTPPIAEGSDRNAEKERIRRQELVKRDAQLRESAVASFVRDMERTRVHEGRFVSIFSLMRDGRELAASLQKARTAGGEELTTVLAGIVDPYLEFVRSEDDLCKETGLRLMDIWRYFRHTWSNQYTSVPGRSMAFLVRDRAAPMRPVVGIGAISSPVVQIRERDTWIGWHPKTFLARVRSSPSVEIIHWMKHVVDQAISELYVADFVEEGVLTLSAIRSPRPTDVKRLLKEAATRREAHHRFVRSKDFKPSRTGATKAPSWDDRARTHLFRSKRALALATLLRARAELKSNFGRRPIASQLAEFASRRVGSDVIKKVLKKAKADRIGISVADITVCGAVQPYNAVLGGKLVAMLAASPEVVVEYRRRYSDASSEIASSMAGRPIVREPNLVLLGTTSLYSVGSSQYNRLSIPTHRLRGKKDDEIRFEELGRSESFGTSQFADDTVAALAAVVAQSEKGQRVNSIFGEGVSPRMRKVREGLDVLSLPSEILLRHQRQRIVYAVRLVENLNEFLLGIEPAPKYRVPLKDVSGSTASVVAWWRERWLSHRIMADRVLEDVARHSLVRPVRHGARVPAAPDPQRSLFEE